MVNFFYRVVNEDPTLSSTNYPDWRILVDVRPADRRAGLRLKAPTAGRACG